MTLSPITIFSVHCKGDRSGTICLLSGINMYSHYRGNENFLISPRAKHLPSEVRDLPLLSPERNYLD